jgi:Raf kinase inhibitor-like YbhB/YbcL family protein
MTLTLTSPAFAEGAAIPRTHTCEGDDVSPAFEWSGLPPGTRSLVLIVDDPDAPDPAKPQRVWVHWVLYNLPPDTTGLPEDVDTEELPEGTGVGVNDWGRADFGGPCPPIGRHRYFHKLYALDVRLEGLRSPTTAAIETAMRGHVLGEATLIGTYAKGG